jgi:hypothetical protein
MIMNTIKNTIKSVVSIFIILMFASCEEDVTDNKLEGYENIPTNLNLTYSLDNESSGYKVNFEATAEGQIFFLLKKSLDDNSPESFTENTFSVTFDQFGTYNVILIAQGIRDAASFELVVEIPEKEPTDFLTTVEPSSDGTGIVNFSMSAANATSYKVEIFEQDGVTLIHEKTTTSNSYTYVFINELLEPVTFNCVVKLTAINGVGRLENTESFSVDVDAGVAPPENWRLFDDMDGAECGGILWDVQEDKTGTLALADLSASVQNGNSSATLRYYHKPSGARYGILKFREKDDGTEFDYSLQSKFRVNVYLPSTVEAPDGTMIDNTDDPGKRIVRLYLEDRYNSDGTTKSETYKRNVWIEKEISAFDQWETLEFDFSNQDDYKYHSAAYNSYKYYVPNGKPDHNYDRMYLRTHVNGDAGATTLFYFDDFELIGIDGNSLNFECL